MSCDVASNIQLLGIATTGALSATVHPLGNHASFRIHLSIPRSLAVAIIYCLTAALLTPLLSRALGKTMSSSGSRSSRSCRHYIQVDSSSLSLLPSSSPRRHHHRQSPPRAATPAWLLRRPLLRPRLRPLAPAPAPAPAPAVVEDVFNPHLFGPGDTWAIGVLRDSFNSMNETLGRFGRPPVNVLLVPSIAG